MPEPEQKGSISVADAPMQVLLRALEVPDCPPAMRGSILHRFVEESTTEGLSRANARAVATCLTWRDLLGPYQREFNEIRLENIAGESSCFGTCDFVGHKTIREAIALDWKFGRWEVAPAHKNVQGEAYASGIHHRFPKLETLFSGFIQPATGMVSFAVYDLRKHEAYFHHKYTALVKEVKHHRRHGVYKPSYLCAFCKAPRNCPHSPQAKRRREKVSGGNYEGLGNLDTF